jgi:hypothetical protein
MKHLCMAAAGAVLLTGCLFKGQAGAGGGTNGGASAGAGGGTYQSGPGYSGDQTAGDGGDPGLDIPGDWSLAERQYWQRLVEEQDVYLEQLNADCGTQITASFVWESFRGKWKAGEDSYGVDAYARAHAATPLTAVRNVCVKGGMEKSAVQAAVGEIWIEMGVGNDQPRLGLQNGVFHVVIEPEHDAAGSWEYEVQQFVEKHI